MVLKFRKTTIIKDVFIKCYYLYKIIINLKGEQKVI